MNPEVKEFKTAGPAFEVVPGAPAANGKKKPERLTVAPGRLYINGQWRDGRGGDPKPAVNPYDDSVITTIAQASEEDLNDAVKAARAAFKTWSKMKGLERAKVLNKIADIIELRLEELALAQTYEMGKNIRQSRFEIQFSADLFRYHAGWAGKLDGSVLETLTDWQMHVYTVREPVGVVAAITPFNVPIYLMTTKLAPALSCGCTFIHKPASNTSVSALKFAEVMEEAGVPAGVYNLLTGPGGVLGKLIPTHPDINKVAFTGSTEVGIGIMKAATDTVKRVTMELGGKSPHVICADANLDQACQNALTGNFLNSGQICTSGSRLIVERPVYDEVIQRLSTLLDGCVIGDPADENTFFGPVSSRETQKKIVGYFDIGRQDGAKAVYGGDNARFDGKPGAFVQPTLFADATNDMRIAREEIFGPILTIIPVKDFDEAMQVANDTAYGLASMLQTTDRKKMNRFAQEIQAGTVWINTAYAWDNAAPFGGYKQSGVGRENGLTAYESYTQPKTVWLNWE